MNYTDVDFRKMESLREMEFLREKENKTLKSYFGSKIKGNFLIKIKDSVMRDLGEELLYLYKILSDFEYRSLTGELETPQYEICRIIVGTHRHHCIFLSEKQISELQKSKDYCEKLVSEVIEKVRLRDCTARYFRKKPLFNGDEFLYFSVPYYLFALCVKGMNLIYPRHCDPIFFEYSSILESALTALTIMENNYLSGAYPVCRGMIELFLKISVIRKHPECYGDYRKFRDYEIKQSCCEQEYPDEFIDKFDNRKAYASKNKIAYLHYGWLDSVPCYNDKKADAYTLNGVLRYLLKSADSTEKKALETIDIIYKRCHAYAHGSASYMRYPLVQYFEISQMVYYVITRTFSDIYCLLGQKIPGEDRELLETIEKDFKILEEQYKNLDTEKLEEYYRIYPIK